MLTFVAFAVVCCVVGFLAAKAFEWRHPVESDAHISASRPVPCTTRQNCRDFLGPSPNACSDCMT